jgi:protein-S-isoprenylcysteine O-methyltransferase Ste14
MAALENTHPKLPARMAARAVLLIVFLDGTLFGLAGRISWRGAWLLTTLFLSSLAVMLPWAIRKAPELLEERMNPGANVKPWDKVILAIYQSLLLAVLVVAALDAGRFRKSTMPPVIQIAGAAVFLALVGWIWWTMSANAYLSSRARIQSDRQQQVATGGPYRYVRHPMYAAIILLVPAMALVLGSWWAMIPAALVGPLFIVRTALEDRMLLDELAGYREYASQVRCRLVPGIW